MSKFGSWKMVTVHEGSSRPSYRIETSMGETICKFDGLSEDTVRLISAAPDLLEAVHAALQYFRLYSMFTMSKHAADDPVVNKLMEAVTKAEGKKP